MQYFGSQVRYRCREDRRGGATHYPGYYPLFALDFISKLVTENRMPSKAVSLSDASFCDLQRETSTQREDWTSHTDCFVCEAVLRH